MANKKDFGLMAAAIFATAVISGSFVFFGMGMNDAALDKRIDAGVERYVQKKQAEMEESSAAAAAAEAEKTKELTKNLVPVSKTADHIYGNPEARVSIVEYSDFQCPYCQRFHDIAKEIVDLYGGQVNWIYRHYPLSGHDPEATLQALASECVAELGGNDKFWEFSYVLFGSDAPSDKTSLVAAAQQLGLNQAKFTQCLESQKHLSKIQQQFQEGDKAGVEGTPGNFVVLNATGEAMYVKGAQGVPVFQRLIDSLLAK